MEHHENSNVLFEKYLSGACTPAEIEFLFQKFGVEADEEVLRRLIERALVGNEAPHPLLQAKVKALTERVGNRLHRNIQEREVLAPSNYFPVLRRWMAVAAVLVAFTMAGIVGYFMVVENNPPSQQLTSQYGGEVLPGDNRATLTLADGRSVALDTEQTGIVMGSEITYVDGTSVMVESAGETSPSNVKSHTLQLSTPKGGQYQITLPDGSRVWLNSASTLKYPSRFDDNERVVELAGEAYFEVSHQFGADSGERVGPGEIPFFVRTKGQVVKVLGTSFNISAYTDDDDLRTTLVTGRVEVSNVQRSIARILIPNQQAIMRGDILIVSDVDVAPYIDWKDGFFSFQETSLQDAMRQLSRWYDLEVTYDSSIPTTYFFGKIRRDSSLSKVLKILQKSGLNFKVTNEGGKNRLTVLP